MQDTVPLQPSPRGSEITCYYQSAHHCMATLLRCLPFEKYGAVWAVTVLCAWCMISFHHCHGSSMLYLGSTLLWWHSYTYVVLRHCSMLYGDVAHCYDAIEWCIDTPEVYKINALSFASVGFHFIVLSVQWARSFKNTWGVLIYRDVTMLMSVKSFTETWTHDNPPTVPRKKNAATWQNPLNYGRSALI